MFQRPRTAALVAAATSTVLLLGTIGTAHAAGDGLRSSRVGTGSQLLAIGYEHVEYGGAALQFFGESCTASSSPQNFNELPSGWNDQISSMRIGGLCGIYAFENTQRTGARVLLNGYVPSMPSGWNDRVSSLQIRYAWWWPSAAIRG
ncbi:hypothetical protein [Streptomyces yaizuensis]|uniref:Beta and gamma crystallin n=1 Tax=Streptomyces yaizuensis TaxID=2989713 RepID=A0ABQ5NR44_9ACTN|nr:hypothetical protein [Streptomyces sp. YSPA8]GLF92853.1 beta and gamma crystallin [Streptomyces sp. YSPA8]